MLQLQSSLVCVSLDSCLVLKDEADQLQYVRSDGPQVGATRAVLRCLLHKDKDKINVLHVNERISRISTGLFRNSFKVLFHISEIFLSSLW